jgi:hypothetical protein
MKNTNVQKMFFQKISPVDWTIVGIVNCDRYHEAKINNEQKNFFFFLGWLNDRRRCAGITPLQKIDGFFIFMHGSDYRSIKTYF